MNYTQTEKDMARKGYVYYAKTVGSGGYRKRATVIDNTPRSELIFDWPAYECRHGPR